MSRAEVIQCKLQAGVLQFFENKPRLFRIFHHERFRQFDPDLLWVAAVLGQDRANIVVEIVVEKLRARQVDGYEDRQVAGLKLPFVEVACSALKGKQSKFTDEIAA